MSLTNESYVLDYNNYFNCSINSDKPTAEIHIANTFDKMVFFINKCIYTSFIQPYAHCVSIFLNQLNQLSVDYNDCDFITTKKRERYSFEAEFLPFGVVVQHPYEGITDNYDDIMIFGLKYKNGNPYLWNIHINHNEKSFLKQEDDQPILTLGDFFDKTSAMLFLFATTPYNEISHKFTKANISQGLFSYPQCSPETKKIIEEDSTVYTWDEFRNLYNSCILESIKLPNDSNPYSATSTKDIFEKNSTASAFGKN